MRKTTITLAYLLLISVLACNRQNNDDDDPSFQFVKGFGSSIEPPEGIPFQWPKGLRLIGEPGTDDECTEAIYDLNRNYGHGGSVGLCLNLYNETDKPISLQLPPGLMFVAKSIEAQHGFLVVSVRIDVPPKQQFLAYLNMICANPPRSSSPGYEYEAQPIITDHPAMKELQRLLENKRCNYEDYGSVFPNPSENISAAISVAAHDLMNGRPIHKQELAVFDQIPMR